MASKWVKISSPSDRKVVEFPDLVTNRKVVDNDENYLNMKFLIVIPWQRGKFQINFPTQFTKSEI